jgi:hypothetical protein
MTEFSKNLTTFVKAAYELSKMWDGLKDDELALVNDSYPLDKDFHEFAADLGDWAQKVVEGLDMIELKKKFEGDTFCLALEDNGVTEEGWFLSVKLRGRTLYLEEEIAGYIHHIDITEFEGNFIQVDKSLYELAMKLNAFGDYDSVCKLQELAKQIKDFDLNM